MSANQNENTITNKNLTLREGSCEHTMVELAKFMGDRIAVKRGDKSLPWTGKNRNDAESKYPEICAYVYTIYELNKEDDEIDTFNKAKLSKWRVLPVFSDLVAPLAVRYDLNSMYYDLLNRGQWELNPAYFGTTTSNGYLMSLEQFNDFTDWVQDIFNLSANDIKTFDDLRKETTLANVIERASYEGETMGYGYMPIPLHHRFHKTARLNAPVQEVVTEYVRDQIDKYYTKQSRRANNNDSNNN